MISSLEGEALDTVVQNLETRRSVPMLVGPAPDRAALRVMLSAAQAAPDHGRLKPWRFVVVEGEALNTLGECFAMADGVDQNDEKACQKARSMPLRAPMMIVVIAKVVVGHKVPEIEQIVAAGAAAQNIQLAAHALGFGVMWRTGAMACDPAIRALFDLEEADLIVGFLYVGSVEKVPPARVKQEQQSYVDEHTRVWVGRDKFESL